MQMRRSMQHIGWAVLLGLVIAGCSRFDNLQTMTPLSTSSALVAVDSLMWLQPDSALALLLPWFDSAAAPAEYDRHYAHLLLSELLYKNYCEQTNRAELLQAESYFDSISLIINDSPHILWSHCGPSFRECGTQSPQTKDDLAFLAARAHYMDGVGHYERDSLVPACREYLKALEIMEDRFGEKELAGHKAMFMALTYTRLTFLFSDSYLHEQAIQYGKSSIRYYQRYDASPWHLAWILDEIGSQYEMMGHFDSACFYFNEAAKSLTDTSILMHRDIITHQTQLEYKMKGDAEASVQQMHQVLLSAQDDKEKLSRYMVIGEIYYYEKSFDSALYYLSKVYKETSNIGAKKQAAEWLIEVYKSRGNEEETHIYAGFLTPFANQEENNSAIKAQLTDLSNSFDRYSRERIRQQEKKNNLKWTLALILSLLLIIIVIALQYYKSKRKQRHLEVQIQKEQFSHEIQRKSLSVRLKNSNETLKEALKRIESFEEEQHDNSPGNGKERYESFLQEPICIEILGRFSQLHADNRNVLKTDMEVEDYKSFALSEMHLAQLMKAIDSHFPEIYRGLKLKDPALNRKDWPYIGLYLLQLDKMSICVLLQESYHTCRRYTMKLERAFNCQHGLTAFLLEQIDSL